MSGHGEAENMERGEAYAGYDSMRQKQFIETGLRNPATAEWVGVGDIPGVGRVSALKLQEHGFQNAYQVVGLYMSLSLDAEAFDHYLCHAVGVVRPDLREMIVRTLDMWCDRHL